MAVVEKSVLVLHSAERMFALVDRVEDYPAFLPWCGGVTVDRCGDAELVAAVQINYHGVRQHFTTRNERQVPALIRMHLVDGPFRELTGEWRFTALDVDACKIEFRLAYEFASPWLAALISPVFNHIAATFVDAFVRRADATEA